MDCCVYSQYCLSVILLEFPDLHVLGNMKNPNVEICSLLESRMNESIQEINKTDSVFDSDKLHSELRILDWIFYQVCKDQQKKLATV
jgi:hypothetical protein